MKISHSVQAIINAAYTEAKLRNHEFLTPEHVLYAALSFEPVQEILGACGADVRQLRDGMEEFFTQKVPLVEGGEPAQTIGFQSVMERAFVQSQSARKEELDVADILVSLYDEDRNYCAYFLRKSGVKRLELLEILAHGSWNDQAELDFSSDASDDGRLGTRKGLETEAQPDQEAESRPARKSALERFATDLTAKASRGELEPLLGREAELERTIQVLCRRLKNNPLHVGDSGVGKTAITEGLAQRIASGDVPPPLQGFSVYGLDMGVLLAGTKYRGDFEDRIKKLVDEVLKKEKAILFIDEIHTLVGAGAVSSGSLDASNLLKPALTSGKIRCIGSTTHEEYQKFMEKDRALVRRFQKIDINEPSVKETVDILEGLRSKYEEYHGVRYTSEAFQTAALLSSQYINDRRLPDKAIDVIDEAGAFAKLSSYATQSPETAEPVQTAEPVLVDAELIEQVLAKIARIPERAVGENEREKLRHLEQRLKSRIFGQDEAVSAMVSAVKRSRAGLRAEHKPVASLLFAGPTGVGKTELARQMAELLGVALHRFDMSEYQEKHTVSRLVGSPPGYVGYEEGGLLTDAIRKQGHAVLLLDEIEKAHPDIFNILLQIMDYATLTDNNGRKADFRNVILVMTSNAGARDIGRSLIGFGGGTLNDGAIQVAVEKTFSPEFRNRLDAVIPFHRLDTVVTESIVRKELDEFRRLLADKQVSLDVSDACVAKLAEEGYSQEFGARNISRLVEDKIKSFFVDEILFGRLSEGGKASADWRDGEYRIHVTDAE